MKSRRNFEVNHMAKKTPTAGIALKPTHVAAPTLAAAPGTPAAGGCTEFSVSFALLTSDNQRQVSFGVTRGCLDAQTPLYVISFLLRDKIGDDFQDRVRLLITVGPESHDKAQAIIDRGLRSSQKDFLEGPITTRAKAAPAGTTEKTAKGQALAKDTEKVLDK
jgi:hypothetical protein